MVLLTYLYSSICHLGVFAGNALTLVILVL